MLCERSCSRRTAASYVKCVRWENLNRQDARRIAKLNIIIAVALKHVLVALASITVRCENLLVVILKRDHEESLSHGKCREALANPSRATRPGGAGRAQNESEKSKT